MEKNLGTPQEATKKFGCYRGQVIQQSLVS